MGRDEQGRESSGEPRIRAIGAQSPTRPRSGRRSGSGRVVVLEWPLVDVMSGRQVIGRVPGIGIVADSRIHRQPHVGRRWIGARLKLAIGSAIADGGTTSSASPWNAQIGTRPSSQPACSKA